MKKQKHWKTRAAEGLRQAAKEQADALHKGATGPGHWDEIPGAPIADWKAEVESDDTRLGYHAWAQNKKENDTECA